MSPDDLTGQVALVTGAGRGIGRAIATHLADLGATSVLLARTRSDLAEVAENIRAGGGAAEVACSDVTDVGAVAQIVDHVMTTWGRIDLVVHSAGTAGVLGPMWESDVDEWWTEVAVHLRGAAVVARLVLPSMIDRGVGRIVNLYGNLGDRGETYTSAYACGKAGLLRLTETLDAETRPHGVRAFAVHPGFVETPMTRDLASSEDGRRWLPRFGEIPEERWDPPDDAVRAVAAIAAGGLDHLAGRLVGAWESLDEVAAPDNDDERTLRVLPPGSHIAR